MCIAVCVYQESQTSVCLVLMSLFAWDLTCLSFCLCFIPVMKGQRKVFEVKFAFSGVMLLGQIHFYFKLWGLISAKFCNVAFQWGLLLSMRQTHVGAVTNILLAQGPILYAHCKRAFGMKYPTISWRRQVCCADGRSKSSLTIKICLEFVAKWLMDSALCSINPLHALLCRVVLTAHHK